MKSNLCSIKKLFSVALVVSMLLSFMACTAKSSPVSSAAKEQVNLRMFWWGGDSRNKATLAAIEAYMKLNPNVKIEGQIESWDTYFEKLLTQLAGGSLPDIVQLDFSFVPDLIKQNKPFVDISTLSSIIDLSGFDMDFARSYGGGANYLIGLPTGINGICSIYNVELAKKLGIDMGKSHEWSYNDLLKVGVAANQKDSDKYFIYFKKELYIHLVKTMLKQMNGNNLINDDKTLGFSRDEMITIFTYIRDLVNAKVVPPFEIGTVYETQIADNPDWLRERYVMTSTYASLIRPFIDASPFEIDSTRFFVKENPVDKGIPVTPVNLFGIYDKSRNVNEAAKFLNWFFNDEEAIRILGDVRGVPSVDKARQILVKEGKIKPQIAKAVDLALKWAGEPDNSASLNTEVTNRLLDFIHEVGYKRMTPAAAADALSKELLLIVK